MYRFYTHFPSLVPLLTTFFHTMLRTYVVWFRSRESPIAFYENKRHSPVNKHLFKQKPVAGLSKEDDQKPSQKKVVLIEEEKLAEGVVSFRLCVGM